MNAQLAKEVIEISFEIDDAVEEQDTFRQWQYYHLLHAICQENQGTESDHPIQWELLGDYTHNEQQAISIYSNALKKAQTLQLDDYCASACYSLALCYQEANQTELAIDYARQANRYAQSLDDLELKRLISETLLELMN